MGQSLQILLGIATVANVIVLMHYRHELRVSVPAAVMLAVFHTIVGVLCVKLFAGLETFSNPLNSGMSLFGGIFFLPVFYAFCAKLFKRDVRVVFDVFGICMVVTLAFARINCILSGCCLGAYIPGTDTQWPTREVEVVFWIILAAVLIVLKERGTMEGRLYLVVMIAYGLFRFVEEFFRQNVVLFGVFHIAHIWAVVCFLIGTTLYFYMIEKAADIEKGPRNA